MKKITINTPFIKLDAALKLSDAVMTGGHGKIVITEGEVTVNGETEFRRGRKLYPGDRFCFDGQEVVVERS